jgi:hypothetical protein
VRSAPSSRISLVRSRRDPATIDWKLLLPQDRARRERTRLILEEGALRTGDDFYHAAFIFQHGEEAKDFLLAHTLAVAAISQGRKDATWIAAATLDRYLQAIGQPQIYGTQFSSPPGKPTTQEPYDRTLVSDALRKVLHVPPLAEQEKRRAAIEERHRRARAAGTERKPDPTGP